MSFQPPAHSQSSTCSPKALEVPSALPGPCSPSQAVPAPLDLQVHPLSSQPLLTLTSCTCSPKSPGTPPVLAASCSPSQAVPAPPDLQGLPLPSQPLLTCCLAVPCPWAAPSASPAPLALSGLLTSAQLQSSLLYFLGSALLPGLARCPRGLREALPSRRSVHSGPSRWRSCPCSPLFSVPPPTPSSGPLLPPVFGSPALCPAPTPGPRAPCSGQPAASWGLWAQPCAARHGHRAQPPHSPVPGSDTALGPSPVRTHSYHTWPCTGTHAGSTGLSRSLHCPGVLSLP